MDEVLSGVRSAIASGAGNEILQPLAIVVLGGLFTSTALTLLVLPALYSKFGKRLMSKQKTIAVKTSFPVNATPQSSVDSPM